jgi:hypothetical protein
VGGADQEAIRRSLSDGAREELPEPSCLFDLTAIRFDNLLAQAISEQTL